MLERSEKPYTLPSKSIIANRLHHDIMVFQPDSIQRRVELINRQPDGKRPSFRVPSPSHS